MPELPEVETVRDQTDVPLMEVDGTLSPETITQTILDRLKA